MDGRIKSGHGTFGCVGDLRHLLRLRRNAEPDNRPSSRAAGPVRREANMPNDDAKADPDITVTDELDPADVAVITDGLRAYDLSQTGYYDFPRSRCSSAIRTPAGLS